MEEHDTFDDTIPYGARRPDEIWLPYADPWERQLRDAIVGPSEAFADEKLAPCSKYVSRAQFLRLYTALSFASYQGGMPNFQFTIAWQKMGYHYCQDIDAAFRANKERMRKYAHRCGVPFHHYAVFEKSGQFGIHSHEAIYIPNERVPRFRKWLTRCLAKRDKHNYRRRLHTAWRREFTPEHQWRWFRYLMKGLDPRLTDYDRERWGYEPDQTLTDLVGIKARKTGELFLRRVRISQDLLHKAQRAAGYRPQVTLDSLDPYTDREWHRGRSDRRFAEMRSAWEELPFI